MLLSTERFGLMGWFPSRRSEPDMAAFLRKAGSLVDAIRLEHDERVPVKDVDVPGTWINAKCGDWLVTDGDNEQKVLTDETFRRLYEPATDEARRVLADTKLDEPF